jgi:hypothetical protein
LRVTTLRDVAFFLNGVTPEMAPAQWEKFLNAAKRRNGLAGVIERLTLDEAKGLRAEVARDLAYRDKNPGRPFASLLGSLNKLALKTQYACLPLRVYGKPLPGQAILKVGKNRFVPRIYPEAKTPKELLYVRLAAALMDGTLGRLKQCRSCGKWTVGKNAGKKFCSDTCRDTWHYDSRRRSGYFKVYQRDRRAALANSAKKAKR